MPKENNKKKTLEQRISDTIRIIKCIHPDNAVLKTYQDALEGYVKKYESEFGIYVNNDCND